VGAGRAGTGRDGGRDDSGRQRQSHFSRINRVNVARPTTGYTFRIFFRNWPV
jgi:hypothetical protein